MALNHTKIDWPKLDYTFNPIIGCQRACSYCYGRRLNDRFKWISDWKKPEFFPERLEQFKKDLMRLKKPSKFFIGSMSDIFGKNIPDDWIVKILGITNNFTNHQFMYLTKNPERYLNYRFFDNTWLGITIDKIYNDTNTKINILHTLKIGGNKTFISFEPLLGNVAQLFDPKNSVSLQMQKIDLLIVGAQTGVDTVIPKKEWIQAIKHPNIHYKNNILKYV